MASRLSLGRFVQIMTGKSPDDADDPKAKARKAAADRATAESLLKEMKAARARLAARNLVYPGLDGGIADDEGDLRDAIASTDLNDQQTRLGTYAITFDNSLKAILKREQELLAKDAAYDELLKACGQRVAAYASQVGQVERADLRALFAKDLMAGIRQELAALQDPKDTRDRVAKITKLELLSSSISRIEGYPADAAAFEQMASRVERELYAAKESVLQLPRAGSQAFANRTLAALSDQFDALNQAPQPDKLSVSTTQMKQLLAELRTLDLSAGPVVEKRAERIDGRLGAMKTKAEGLPTKLAPAVKQTLDKLRQRVDLAAAGRGPGGAAVTVEVGQSKFTLGSHELLRGIEGGIKGLAQALSDPQSAERAMMELEGPDELVDELIAIHTQLVAFGMAPPPLSAAELYALRCYTSQDYGAMNQQRLGQLTDKRAETLNRICDEALAKLPPYPKAAWPVFRIERAWDQDVVDKRYKRGNTFMAEVLWSTGARGAADVASSKTEGPQFIHTIFGRSGRDIAALSTKPGEGSKDDQDFKTSERKRARRDVASGKGEVLFPATARFNVTDRTDPPGGKKMLVYSKKYPGGIDPIKTRLKEL